MRKPGNESAVKLKTLWSTVYHEAGHAVVGWCLHRAKAQGVTIMADKAALTRHATLSTSCPKHFRSLPE
jgi:ATP-dependent Zn protease